MKANDLLLGGLRLGLPLSPVMALPQDAPAAASESDKALAQSEIEEAAALRRFAKQKETPPVSGTAPYPPSPIMDTFTWAPADSTLRTGRGSDVWPLAWADNDTLYTAYGDGWGFKEPGSFPKLSMGVAKVDGAPPDLQCENIPSPTGETYGDGPKGEKPSGMIMIDGVLYMLIRNADLSQLLWSTDYAKTWTRCDWKFEEGLACPCFCSFGRNYAGARDGYVYVYSYDSHSAYFTSDTMILARAPKERLRERGAWKFFVKIGADGQPVWSADIKARGAVFSDKGRCFRCGVSYCPPLKRYLWVQVNSHIHKKLPYPGGFAIYDAPEPWGPWTTLYFTHHWDRGVGETASIPPKWMGQVDSDGKLKMWFVFSGEDSFEAREFTLALRK